MKFCLTTALLCLFILFSSAYPQTNEKKPFDEFGNLSCEFLLMHSDGLFHELKKNPDSKAFIVFYEGKHSRIVRGDKYQLFNPRRGEGRNTTEAISLYLTKWRKLPKERLVIIDGGFDTEYRVEIWIVPNGSEPPTPKPTLTEKDIKFSKGKPPPVVDCQKIYSDI